jgi:hypothetical protein
MADSAEDDVGGVAVATFEIEVIVLFHVADHGLDGGAASELAFDDAEHAALLTREEDAARIWRIVTAVSLST